VKEIIVVLSACSKAGKTYPSRLQSQAIANPGDTQNMRKYATKNTAGCTVGSHAVI
jgi:hypothetical protein